MTTAATALDKRGQIIHEGDIIVGRAHKSNGFGAYYEYAEVKFIDDDRKSIIGAHLIDRVNTYVWPEKNLDDLPMRFTADDCYVIRTEADAAKLTDGKEDLPRDFTGKEVRLGTLVLPLNSRNLCDPMFVTSFARVPGQKDLRVFGKNLSGRFLGHRVTATLALMNPSAEAVDGLPFTWVLEMTRVGGLSDETGRIRA